MCQTTLVLKHGMTQKPPKSTYNHLQPPQKFQQPPTTTSENQEPLEDNLKPSIARHKCVTEGETTCHVHEIRESNKTSTSP